MADHDGNPLLTSEGEVNTVETVANEPLVFPDFSSELDRLRTDAQKVFDVRDYERWLDQELEPHTVEVGDMKMVKDMESLAADARREDDEKTFERAKELGVKIEEARDHVSKYFNLGKDMEAETQWRLREEEVAARERVVFEHQAKEAALLTDLNQRYGILQKVPHDPFSWTVEWNMAPQEFTINVTSLRGLRNKVRNGYYVVLASVVDRVGGSTIRFSTGEKNRDLQAALPPLRVHSKSRNVDRFVNHSVELMCPSPLLLQTHAILQFEIWQLRMGGYDPVDKVVGFGYWPLVGQDMRVKEGKFKVPLLVGEATESVDTFRQIGSILESGLQYWLGNIYFEIKHLRRNRDRSDLAQQQQEDLGGFGGSAVVTGEQLRLDRTADDIRSLTFPHLPPRLFFDDVKLGDEGDAKGTTKGDLRDMNHALWEKRGLLEEEKTSLRSEMVRRKTRSMARDLDDDDEITEMRMRSELNTKGATKRKLGEFYPAEGDDEDKMRDSHILIQEHHHALASQREFFFMGRRIRDKAIIAWSVVQYDFGVNKGGPWDKTKVVINLIFLLFGYIARMVVHAVAKYLFLSFLDVPLTKEEWVPWHIDLRFDFTTRFYPWDTVGTSAIGFAVCIGFFFFMSLAFFLLLMIFDQLPYSMTRFAFWFGVTTTLDPLFTAITEASAGNFDSGDPFLLYIQFDREEGTGYHGAALITFLYMTMAVPHIAVLVWYSIYVHLNGRAEDIYTRLVYPESSFFMPHDLEMGEPELLETVKHAHAYRNDSGDIKRVAVEEVNAKYVCMFRERLFTLLSIADNNPDTWINEYFDSIALRRPRWAKDLIEDRLGSFELGKDILLFMKRNFPHLCMYTRHMVGDSDEDYYYESDLVRGISTHSTALEDEREMREFLKSYFFAQVYGEKPVEWSRDDPSTFILRDKQLLADLIFFETSGESLRSLRLYKRIRDFTKDYLFIEPDEPETWQPIALPQFTRGERFKSIEGADANGVLIIMTQENLAHNTKSLQRMFVITPTGVIFEPTQSSFSYQTHHTADHVEFWAANATLRGLVLQEQLTRKSKVKFN